MEAYDGVEDEADQRDGQPLQDDPAEDHDVDGEVESEGVDLQSVAEVLTVTAKKLQSITLGRKYSGKRTSHCSACGSLGHRAGDPECPVSSLSKGAGKGHSKDGKTQHDKGGKSAKKLNSPCPKIMTLSLDISQLIILKFPTTSPSCL